MADDTDPMFEFFDAPKYVDFTDMCNLMEDDGADQWFDHHNEEDGEFEYSLVPSENKPLATPAYLIDNDQEPVDVDSVIKKEPSMETSSEEATSKSEKKVPNLKKFFAKKDNPLQKEKRSPRVAAQKANTNIKCILSKRQSPWKTRVRKPSGDSQHESKTTEDLQMEEIKRLQTETRKRLRQNRRSFRKLASSSGPIAVKGTKPTTQAKEFNFHTKKKDQPVSTKSQAMNVTNFPSTLRSSSSADTYNPNFPTKSATPDGVTKVKPFHFHLDERLNQKSAHQTQGDVPTAEAILKFEKSTPPRFRRNPTPSKKSAINTSTGSCGKTMKLTMPKTPKLMAKGRSRPVTAMSAADEEEKEVAKMKEYQFKANPLNPDIFLKGGLYGVPRKRTDFQSTEAHTPELATKKRCLSRRTDEQETMDDGTFHANPMPNFDKIKGVPEKKVMPVTEPDTPAITAKRQCLSDGDDSREEQTVHVLKANPLPDLNKVFKVELPHRILQAKPFSFEVRDKEKPTRETFVQRILRNEKKPEFRAQPLPDFGEAPALPPKTHLLPTKVEPFSLKTELRGQQHSIKFHEQVVQEIRGAKRDAEFKAHETIVLYSKPFMPKKSSKPLATIDNFQLHTELRSEKRFKFDAERYHKEREIETENLRRSALREAKEARDIAQYRKFLVHKAQPIHHYEPIVIHGSDRPATEPISPHFLTDERLRK